MPTTTIQGFHLAVDDEGFLADPAQWNERLADALATQIGIALTDRHRQILDILRSDFQARGETATLRRAAMVTGVPVKELFVLFPKKPAKKMAYVAGLPKPTGCV